VVSSLRARFIEAAHDKLDAVDAAIGGIEAGNDVRLAKDLKEIAHSLKGMAGSFGFMSVTQISEAFEHYLDAAINIGVLPATAARDYSAAMRGIIKSGNEPTPQEVDAIIAALPAPAGAA